MQKSQLMLAFFMAVNHSLSAGRTGIQSIGVSPRSTSHWLVCTKWLQPKKPRCAESGDGCGAFSTQWRWTIDNRAFLCAWEPHSRKTTPSQCSLIKAITLSVRSPSPDWRASAPVRRGRSGPYSAAARPVVPSFRDNRGWGGLKPGIVASSSLYIFSNEGGDRDARTN
ncbi:Uncharacterised protein [Klebsiella pneumoniae]|uniref:Uncharacterized protein n=1 Tax=Klebsiella pneumoniae TaxID=573 RepID=A0A377WMH6_KLEPN|nr:Uncharacterised protein [Klebsiella pneumoniae]